ncbi:Ryanodine receptor Ryr [Clostridium sp. Mt-5]|uniref:Ryanodine receptor Ryr n=1 Tax=Clostridium moutaii TaxID=3240932 RepID=A0ABV4BQ19_9CLOT
MKIRDFNIVVSGDVCVNLLFWQINNEYISDLNWQQYPHIYNRTVEGESLLLAKLVALSTGANVISPKIDYAKDHLPKGLLSSTIQLGLFPATSKDKDRNKVYRVKEFLGFTEILFNDPQLFPIIDDDKNASMVILDDENNGFNNNEEFWPSALKEPGNHPTIIYKMDDPSKSTKLWKHLEQFHMENTIVVINGDDLRSKEVNISKNLSWERTALDFVWQIKNNPTLTFLSKCNHLIVPLGLEGAIYYYRNKGEAKSQLYFLTYAFEGDFIKETQGKMYGLTSCFVAGLAKSVALGKLKDRSLDKSIDDGIREGITAAQKYFMYGFGKNIVENIFPNPLIFSEGENDFIYKEYIQDVQVPSLSNPNCQSCWYIIKDKSSTNLAEIAYDIVKNGEESALEYIPIAQFGKLKTVDRDEFEAYKSIKNLMSEYVLSKNTVRPLSIAVFGTPGSGKSFGVTEVASCVAPNLIEKLDFNLSQFQTLSDLIISFHKIRDISLVGKIPLVFFDEFDSTFEKKLGWLKYFLAPMQDGIFREDNSIHPIGKAIFVFAGGTSSTFKEFCGEDIENKTEYREFFKEFQSAKGPDFISRLRGYVNILGPNQTDERWDQLFIIRRAMLLRSLLEHKVPHLINERGEAQIDKGVLRALLKVSRYKHESRSMEAILEMSRLTNAKKWEQSYLPPKDQLRLHVDEDEFFRHLMRDEFFNEKVEQLSVALNYSYIMIHKSKDEVDLSPDKYWMALSEGQKNSIRDHIRHIPDILYKVYYDLISVSEKEKPEIIEFTEKELNILAKYEHEYWLMKKKETDFSMPSWDSLSNDSKDKIIDYVKCWPKILANANFKIERLKFACYCESHLKFV